MFRTLLLATLAASTSFACTIENAGPTDEGPVASDEGALPIAEGELLSESTITTSTVRQRFDFVLTADDLRTCASFTKSTLRGSWRGFSTFPTAPAEIANKRCAAVFTPKVSGTKATVDELGLNCREGLTARERWCSRYGTLCAPTSVTVMRPASSTSVAASDIASACPVDTKIGVIGTVPEMYSLTYTGGCTSCGTISGGLLYLNSPNSWSFVTYNVGGAPRMIGFDGLNGPLTYGLESGASGPVMVSY